MIFNVFISSTPSDNNNSDNDNNNNNNNCYLFVYVRVRVCFLLCSFSFSLTTKRVARNRKCVKRQPRSFPTIFLSHFPINSGLVSAIPCNTARKQRGMRKRAKKKKKKKFSRALL
uniref:Uncharacterized protein n=1 Tax=Trypanosoma vivax (strain Y486) TaxID=1055687 RepID=G0U906_TRYVY|nr:hypothetical protein, unlikely [Trypanosoma vivax Y486]